MAPTYYYSPETQAMANLLPEEWRLRTDQFSVGQQLLNPMASKVAHLRDQMRIGISEKSLMKFPLKSLSCLYRVYLGDSWTPTKNNSDPQQITDGYTTILGVDAQGVHVISILPSLEELEECLPNRIALGESRSLSTPVLTATAVGNLAKANFNLPTFPGRLYLTLSGAAYAGMNKGSKFFTNQIELTGITTRGLQETEVINLPGNFMVPTVKSWSRLINVRARYIEPVEATLQIDDAATLSQDLVDQDFTVNMNRQDRYVFWKLDNGVLSRQVAITVSSQAPILETEMAWQIADETGNALSGASDFTLLPYQDKLIVLNNNTLYFYDKRQEYPDTSVMQLLKEKTANCSVIIDSSGETYLPGEVLSLRPIYHLLGRNVRQFRYRIATPGSGLVPYKQENDTLVPGSDIDSWILNTLGNFNLPTNDLKLTLNVTGYWAVALDVIYDNGDLSTDVRLVGCLLKPALTSFPLPETLSVMTKIFVDNENNLWVSDGTTIQRVNLHRDYVVLDLSQKLLYCLERYEQVSLF